MKKTILAALALIALAGCSKNDEAISLTTDNEVRISSSIATRTSGNDWENGDAIGVYMTTNGGTFSDLGSNVLYTTTETNGLGNFTSDNPLYYPASSTVDLLAYYPYVASTEESPFDVAAYPIDVTSQSDQGAIDLLSESVTGQALTNSAVEMLFDHKLSRIALTIEAGDGLVTADLADLIITLVGTYAKASYDLTEASDSPITLSETADIVMLTAEGGQSSEAIVIPQTLTDVSLTFETTDYGIFEVALPNESFEVGNEYIYKVTLNRTGVTISCQTINEWGEGEGEDLEATVLPVDIELIEGVYYINTAKGLQAFADLVNGVKNITANAEGGIEFGTDKQLSINGVLTADVDLGDVEWTPIGIDYDNSYSGKFDGGDHLVSGFSVTGYYDAGLFGYTDSGAEISNLGVDGSVSGDICVGGVVGYNEGGNVTNCYNIGSVSGGYTGGVVGENYYGTITNCYNKGEVSGDIYAGGVVGENYGGTITNCYNMGGVSSPVYAGGVVGNNLGAITNCYNKGEVSGDIYAGGVAGYNYSGGTITNCYNTGGVSGEESKGGVAGYNHNSTITCCYWDSSTADSGAGGSDSDTKGMTTDEMQSADFVITLNNNAYTYNESLPTVKACAWVAVSGDSPTFDFDTDPTYTRDIELIDGVYYINNAAGLQEFADKVNSGDLSINGMLMRDIDLGGDAWTPIGDDQYKYSGKFDGGGHLVSGFSVTTSDSEGFFGSIDSDAEISNLGVDGSVSSDLTVGGVVGYNDGGNVTNCYNIGSVSGGFAGGVVGYNEGGTIANCYNTGDVSGNASVGGVVGENYCGTITNCYNKGEVSGYFAGGVVGENYDGTITNCYNMGGVSSTVYAGGVVGNNLGTITNCYNKGEVNGESNAGGVAGYNYSGGTITNCYNTGGVSGEKNKGGVAGYNHNSTITCCYWDSSTADSGAGGSDSDTKGMTTDEMKSADFVTTLNNNAYAYNNPEEDDDKPAVQACAWIPTDEYPTLDFDGVPSE